MTTPELDRAAIRERVVEALSSVLGRELADVDDSTRLFDDLNLDSTSVLGMLMELEDKVGMEVDADELEPEHLETVGALTDFILAQVTRP